MRVLVISQHFWPETFRINDVVESLQLANCNVTVLTGQPNYPDGIIYPGYRAMAMRQERHAAGYTIYRVPVFPRGVGSGWRLALNYLTFLTSASILGPWMLRGRRFDAIFVYGISPILQALAGIVLKRIKKAALITWVQDLWPQSLEVTGFVRNRHLLDTVATLVRWIYRRSDVLLVQSRDFIPQVRAMAGNTLVEYHPNPGELAFAQPRALATDDPLLTLVPGFNVVFAGNLGTVQALDTILAAAELLLPHRDVRLVLIGSGSRGEWLRQEIARRGLGNMQLPGRYAAQAMPRILAQASALLVSLVRSPIMSQTVPSKIPTYLAAGRPIIAALDGEGARVVEESGAGVTCPAEDATALAQAVLSLRSASVDALRGMGEAGRSYYARHFDPTMLANRLVKCFRMAAVARRRQMKTPAEVR